MSKRSAVVAYHATNVPGKYVKFEVFHFPGKYTMTAYTVDVARGKYGVSEGCMLFDGLRTTVEPAPRFNAKRLAAIKEMAPTLPFYGDALAALVAKDGLTLTGEVLDAAEAIARAPEGL